MSLKSLRQSVSFVICPFLGDKNNGLGYHVTHFVTKTKVNGRQNRVIDELLSTV